MCRRPIYFKGFGKVREQWDEESWETRCSEVLSEAIDECVAEALEMAEYFPAKFKKQIVGDIINDVVDIEKTFRFLKTEGYDSDDIEYVLMETTDYYSDRHLNKARWLDEPVKEWVSKYLRSAGSARCGKRQRAFEDEWAVLNVVILI